MARKVNRRKPNKKPRRKVRLQFSIPWRRLALVPVIGCLAVAAFLFTERVMNRPVAALDIEGTFQRVSPMEVSDAAAIDLRRGFLGANLRELRRSVEALTWVDRAEVERRWPDRIVIRVHEHEAAARWGERGLLNVRGELFERNAQHVFPELPELWGPTGSEAEVAARYLDIRARLAQASLSLRALRLDERGAWSFFVDGDVEVRLGRDQVEVRTNRFFETLAPALPGALDTIAYVDMRYSNGFAVGWRDASLSRGYAALSGGQNRG